MSDAFDDGEEHGGEHGEPWLVSYADLMTLLFGFFVVMYSFAAAKLEEGTVSLRQEVAEYFGGGVVNPLENSMSKFKEELKNAGANALESIGMRLFPEGVEISFQSKALFASGSAQLSELANKLILKLSDHIADEKGVTDWNIMVEGHTDDVPIRSHRIYPSNWELSAARASSVIRLFESKGFTKTNLKAIGYADTRPLLPNRDENGNAIKENQDKNRRILIKISLTEIAQVKASEQRGETKRALP